MILKAGKTSWKKKRWKWDKKKRQANASMKSEMEIWRISWEFKELQQSFDTLKAGIIWEDEIIKEAGNCRKRGSVSWYQSSVKECSEKFSTDLLFSKNRRYCTVRLPCQKRHFQNKLGVLLPVVLDVVWEWKGRSGKLWTLYLS